jgi:hypothetical protein
MVRSDEWPSHSDSQIRLRRALAEYIRNHPHASDTLPGILDFWIPRDLYATPREVEAALDDLVARGMLQRTQLIDHSQVYSASPDAADKQD